MYKNMWKEFKGIGVRQCLWAAARSTTDYMFNKHMDEMKKVYIADLYMCINAMI